MVVMNTKCIYSVIYLRVVMAMDALLEDLLTPLLQLGEKCGYESCPTLKEGWINVHLVPHSHGELGLAKTFNEYYSGDSYGGGMRIRMNWKNIFDSTISELWAEKHRKFTISDSELPYFFHWWARRDGTVRRMVYELVRQGRLVFVGGGWGMHDEASTSYQSIIDSYTYSLRKINATFLSCGRPLVAWQADAFGHSREYASLVAQMGFDALYINPLSFDDELLRMERRALEFVWRGSDDLGAQTDIYTHKLFDGYWSPPGFCFGSTCEDPLLVTSDTLFNNVDERIEEFVTLIRHRQWPHYNTHHVLVMMGRRLGYYDAKLWFANVDKLIHKLNERTYKNDEKIHATYSSPVCYLKAVYEENKAAMYIELIQLDPSRSDIKYIHAIPFLMFPVDKDGSTNCHEDFGLDPVLETKQDDFFPYAYNKNTYMTGMYTTRPTFKYLVRESNVYLQMAKQLQVLINLGNNDKLFENFNWIMGVVQDHNIISGVMRDRVASYYVQKLHSAVQWATELFQNAFNKIRKSPPNTEYRLCYLNISSCPNTKLDRFHVTIYNPLAWPVTVPVRLPIRNIRYQVFDPSGTKIKAIKISIPDHVFDIPNRVVPVTNELVFIAQNVPALGLRSYFIEKQNKVRQKKSLIKKISKNQQKKYYIRQAPKENGTFFENDYDGPDVSKLQSKIEFSNIHKLYEVNDYDALTPNYTNDVNNIKDFDETLIINANNESPIKNFDDIEITTNNIVSSYKNYEEFENIPYNNESAIKSFDDYEMKTDANESISNSYDESEIIDTESKKTNKVEISTNENIPATSEINELDTVGLGSIGENISAKDKPMIKSTENINSNEKYVTENRDFISIKEKTTKHNEYKFKTWIPENFTVIPKEEPSLSDLHKDDYYSRESKDNFIRNQYIQINLDEYRKITSMNLSNGVNTSLDIQYYVYISDEPVANSSKRPPGAYIFRSVDVNPEPIIDFIETRVYKSCIVEEIHTKYSKYASFAVKLYTDSPIVEIDWVIGPVPVEDNFGREVFIRYTTDLENDGVFYTDANGRQMLKRIRHLRPMYEPYNLDPVAGNFYPVTSRIYIEDKKKNYRFSIFNDRSQGGSSLIEGSIDMMVHRRILTDETGAFIFINETEDGKGLIVRGNHYLYLTKADYKQNRVFEKRFAKEVDLKPQIMVNRIKQDVSRDVWKGFNNEFTAINKKLPIGVHILTIQEWNDKTMLLRLENYLENVDVVKSGVKKVYLNDLFVNIRLLSLTEMNLSGNMLLKDKVRLNWRVNGSYVKNFNQFYGSNGNVEYSSDELKLVDDVNIEGSITLVPQQIRTFVVKYEYIESKVN